MTYALVRKIGSIIILISVMGRCVVAVTAVVAVVAVAVLAIAAIFAVTAIAVIIAVLPLRHVHSVEYDAGVGELAVLYQRVEQADAGLRRIVGTADKAADICKTGYLQGVGSYSFNLLVIL